MCVIILEPVKTKYPCKTDTAHPILFKYLLFYFIEIILLNSQIEFDLRRPFLSCGVCVLF